MLFDKSILSSRLTALNLHSSNEVYDARAGSTEGSKVLHSLFTHYNITPTLDSIVRNYLRPMNKYSGWFKARYYEEEKRIESALPLEDF